MKAVRTPMPVVAAAVLVLFALAIFATRQYGAAGAVSHLALALGAGLGCLVVVGGLIYANYEHYTARRNGDRHAGGVS
ncbi:MAG: hypothetical protein ACLFV3_02585 [Phycisphaeraceae bacterium]